MNTKSLGFVVLSGLFAIVGFSAETTPASANLRENYVEGLKLISEARTSLERASEVLAIVEIGCDTQARRIAEMEMKLAAIQSTNAILETQGAREVAQGKKLMAEKAQIDERFAALAIALDDSNSLLKGATKTVGDLLTAADKSGRLGERRLADQSAEMLKREAEKLHFAAIQLGQMQLRVKLEFTLLQGLQQKAVADIDEIKSVNADQVKLAAQVGAQRQAIDRLSLDLLKSRAGIDRQNSQFSQGVEGFRIVQVAVLRRWLLDGPPAGELPSLTITDVVEGGFAAKAIRPTPDQTLLGPSGSGGMELGGTLNGRGEKGSLAGTGVEDSNVVDPGEAAPEVIQLHKRTKWHLAMLSRLSSFVEESLNEASVWSGAAEAWRNQLSRFGKTLADQRGTLSSMQMEQDIVTTTVALMASQATTAQEQVSAICSEMERRSMKLKELTHSLEKQSKDPH